MYIEKTHWCTGSTAGGSGCLGTSVEGAGSGGAISILHQLWSACRKVQDPGAECGGQPQILKLGDQSEGNYGVER